MKIVSYRTCGNRVYTHSAHAYRAIDAGLATMGEGEGCSIYLRDDYDYLQRVAETAENIEVEGVVVACILDI